MGKRKREKGGKEGEGREGEESKVRERSEGEREKQYKVIDREKERPRKGRIRLVITMDKVHLHTKFQQNTLACAC